MGKRKVFISFDFDNDHKLKLFLVGQSNLPDSPFEISDVSLKEAAPEKDWQIKAKAKIKSADLVIVMVGPYTHKAPGVLKEVKMANELGKKVIQIIGYKNGAYTRVDGAGILYNWNWDNLKKLLS